MTATAHQLTRVAGRILRSGCRPRGPTRAPRRCPRIGALCIDRIVSGCTVAMGSHDRAVARLGASPTDAAATPALVGRDAEALRLRRIMAALPRRGACLLIRGEAGVGKTSLVASALDEARQRGIPVAGSTSIESEAQLAFAGLHMLIEPLFDDVDRLPAGQRRAILAAFGMIHAPAPDLFLIALGTLELLANAARERGLVVAVGDAQWLDGPTATVISFIAPRCAARRVVMLIEVRDGLSTPLTGLSLPELRIEPLREGSARSLLDASSPGLPELTRDWLLALAAGNPLALVEIPRIIAGNPVGTGATDQEFTLSHRLERAFGARLRELPAITRTLVVVAAENDEAWIGEATAAATLIDADADGTAFGPAVDAGLLTIDQTRIHFRHPLVRSAVRAAALSVERVRAHQALAQVLARDPDRQAWHRAAATTEPDEAVEWAAAGGAVLAAVASRAGIRGGAGAAVVALARAAQLSPVAAARGRRQLR